MFPEKLAPSMGRGLSLMKNTLPVLMALMRDDLSPSKRYLISTTILGSFVLFVLVIIRRIDALFFPRQPFLTIHLQEFDLII